MTNINDIKIESCSSSADLVAYLYDELNAADRASFETHLAGCGGCTDEFADLSFARLDVYEWHRDEFAHLETPRFVIPYTEAGANLSWIDALRGFFASHSQWATAGGAFALVAVIFGAVFVLSSSGADETAGTAKIQPSEVTKAPPAVKDVPAGTTTAAKSDGEPQVVKISTNGNSSRPANAVNRRPSKAVERNSIKMVTAQRAKPRLNEFEDEDDNTLRLGDLLADVGTRKY